uniref:Putative disease resistance protein At1g50180 isoform X2 n=1 Tax=Rhizophora mucronata TaxID=61149 RepID=A0A2P2JCK4_RHIMU
MQSSRQRVYFSPSNACPLSSLEGIVEWEVEKGTMPWLVYIFIRSCEGVNALPEGLSHVTTL